VDAAFRDGDVGRTGWSQVVADHDHVEALCQRSAFVLIPRRIREIHLALEPKWFDAHEVQSHCSLEAISTLALENGRN
jgi:hypothetical protein